MKVTNNLLASLNLLEINKNDGQRKGEIWQTYGMGGCRPCSLSSARIATTVARFIFSSTRVTLPVAVRGRPRLPFQAK